MHEEIFEGTNNKLEKKHNLTEGKCTGRVSKSQPCYFTVFCCLSGMAALYEMIHFWLTPFTLAIIVMVLVSDPKELC